MFFIFKIKHFQKIALALLLLILSNCQLKEPIKTHGINFLENRSKKILVNKSNKNDVLEILGPPSTKSSFDDNIWVYIETKKTSTSIFKLGKRNTEKNNILILQLDDLGLIKTKSFYDLAKMNEIEFSEKITSSGYQKNSYVYNLLTSLRHKINSPIERTKSKK